MDTNENKKLTELTEEELKIVTGDAIIRGYQRTCDINQCPPGERLDTTLEPCQCVPVPNP